MSTTKGDIATKSLVDEIISTGLIAEFAMEDRRNVTSVLTNVLSPFRQLYDTLITIRDAKWSGPESAEEERDDLRRIAAEAIERVYPNGTFTIIYQVTGKPPSAIRVECPRGRVHLESALNEIVEGARFIAAIESEEVPQLTL